MLEEAENDPLVVGKPYLIALRQSNKRPGMSTTQETVRYSAGNCKITADVSRVTCDNDAEPFPKLLDEVTHLAAGHRFRLSYCCGRIQRRSLTERLIFCPPRSPRLRFDGSSKLSALHLPC